MLSAVAEMAIVGAASVLDKLGGAIAVPGRIFLLTGCTLMLIGYILYALQPLISLLPVAAVSRNSGKIFQIVVSLFPFLNTLSMYLKRD
jgi:hypothetical protein